MTIRLSDLEAQLRYDRELEDYRKEVDRKMERPVSPSGWPTAPKQPEPMLDSQDAEAPSANPFALVESLSPAFGRDPRFPGAVQAPIDGSSHDVPKGYETRWTSCDEAPSKPFTLKK